MRNLTIYPKLILYFLMVIVPIYTVSLLMNQSGESNVKAEISMSMSSKTHFYLRTFETEINRVLNLKSIYTNDADLQQLSITAETMNNYFKAQSVLDVKNKLLLFQNTSPYIKEVSMYIPALNRSIFSDNLNESIPEEELNRLKTAPSESFSPLFIYNNKLFMSGTFPESVYKRDNFALVMGIEISIPKIMDDLSNITNQGGALLYNSDQKWSISDGKNMNKEGDLEKFLSAPGHKIGTGEQRTILNGKPYWIAYEYSAPLNLSLAIYTPEEAVVGPLIKYQQWLWTISVISLMFVFFFSYWLYRIIHQPIKKLVIALRKVEKGELTVELKHSFGDEFQYLYEQFNSMVKRLNVLIHDVFEQQILTQRSELKQLQSQINPHFLYNSFFSLHFLAKIQNFESVTQLTKYLGEYFQFLTRNASDEVTLEEEVNHAKTYFAIQSIRFSNRIDAQFDELPEQLKKIMVPRLIIQPIIENAYQHGLEDKKRDGKIEVRIQTDDQKLVISVEDNGEYLSESGLKLLQSKLEATKDYIAETTGMINVHRRIQLKYGVDYGLHVSFGKMCGLKVNIIIPTAKD